jgi:hypothetical protein
LRKLDFIFERPFTDIHDGLRKLIFFLGSCTAAPVSRKSPS